MRTAPPERSTGRPSRSSARSGRSRIAGGRDGRSGGATSSSCWRADATSWSSATWFAAAGSSNVPDIWPVASRRAGWCPKRCKVGFDLDSALARSVAAGASDLHLKVPSVPRMRVDGVLVDLPGSEPLEPEETAKVMEQVLTLETKQRQFEEIGSADISYFTEESRYRVSAFLQRGLASFVFRVVPSAPDVSQL